jgi:hypothetical protein
VLNYLRLVPARWRDASTVERYEVLVYALNPKGPERVKTPEGQPLAFSLSRDQAAARWVLAPLAQTLVADARDAAGAAFSAPPSPSERADLASQVAASPAPVEPAGPGATSISADAAPPAGAAANAAVSAGADKLPASPVVDAPQTAADSAAEDAEALAKRKAKEDAEQAASEAAGAAFKKKLPGGL